MDVVEFYSTKDQILEKAHSELQNSAKSLKINILGPEVFEDVFSIRFLAFNAYMFLDFNKKGKLVVTESYGKLPKLSNQLGRLASFPQHLLYSARKHSKKQKIPTFKHNMEFDVIPMIDGVLNADFVVKPEQDLELITSNAYLASCAEGCQTITKDLSSQQYLFYMPFREALLDALNNPSASSPENKLEIIKTVRSSLLSKNEILGFKIFYFNDSVNIRPVIPEIMVLQNLQYFSYANITPLPSEIKYVGKHLNDCIYVLNEARFDPR